MFKSLGIMISVVVGFQYTLKEKFPTFLCIVISRKLMLLSTSFSMVNVIVGNALLKLSRSSSILVVVSLYMIEISSTYRK